MTHLRGTGLHAAVGARARCRHGRSHHFMIGMREEEAEEAAEAKAEEAIERRTEKREDEMRQTGGKGGGVGEEEEEEEEGGRGGRGGGGGGGGGGVGGESYLGEDDTSGESSAAITNLGSKPSEIAATSNAAPCCEPRAAHSRALTWHVGRPSTSASVG